MSENPSNVSASQISAKDVILKLREWGLYLKSKFLIIAVCCLLGGIAGLIYGYVEKKQYKASLSFFLENENNGSNAAALGLASQLGVDIGGNNSSSNAFAGDNLKELVQSRMIIEKALLNKMPGQNISFAQYYIKINKLYESWAPEQVKMFQFEPNIDRADFTIKQDSVLDEIQRKVKDMISIDKGKKSNILIIEMRCTDELFTKFFVDDLAAVLSSYYIETKTSKAKTNVDILQRQSDSLRLELNRAIHGVAVSNDDTYNLNPALNVKKITSTSRQIDVQINTALLSQVTGSLEAAKITLRNAKPLIVIIDKPMFPLVKEKIGKVKAAFLGGVLLAFFAVAILIVGKIFKDLMY